MRKFLFILSIVLLVVYGRAETVDSLKAKREVLYQKYSEIDIPGKDISSKEMGKAIEILKDLVIIDTRIIKEYSSSDKLLKEDLAKIRELNTEIDTLKSEKESATDFLFIIYIAGGVIVVFLVFSVVMLFIYFTKYRRVKKKISGYADIIKDVDSERLRVSKVNELLTQKESEIAKLGQLVKDLNAEVSGLNDRLKKSEGVINEMQKSQQPSSSEYNEQIEKVNINMSKIEKLGRMKELGIVTEEEFNTFKQKFLGEL